MILFALGFGATGLAHFGANNISEAVQGLEGYAQSPYASKFFWMIVIATTVGLALSFTSAKHLEGVGASNLAGRTLAELILEHETHRKDLPLVGGAFPSWEPEPLRFLGYAALTRFAEALDDANIHGRPTPRLRGAIYDRFVRK